MLVKESSKKFFIKYIDMQLFLSRKCAASIEKIAYAEKKMYTTAEQIKKKIGLFHTK
jgi:hypothetical protein